MYTKNLALIAPERTMTNFQCGHNMNRKKNELKMKEYEKWAWVSIPQFNHSFSMCTLNLKIPACTVLGKTATQIYLGKTEKTDK